MPTMRSVRDQEADVRVKREPPGSQMFPVSLDIMDQVLTAHADCAARARSRANPACGERLLLADGTYRVASSLAEIAWPHEK